MKKIFLASLLMTSLTACAHHGTHYVSAPYYPQYGYQYYSYPSYQPPIIIQRDFDDRWRHDLNHRRFEHERHERHEHERFQPYNHSFGRHRDRD